MIATACNIIDSWPRCKMAEVVNRFGKLAEKKHLDSDTSFEKAVSEAVESTATVVEAIQPILVKSVRVAVSAAVSMAFKQMRREFEAVEEMKKEAAKVNKEMTRLRARVQTAPHPGQTRTVQRQRECADLRNSRVSRGGSD